MSNVNDHISSQMEQTVPTPWIQCSNPIQYLPFKNYFILKNFNGNNCVDLELNLHNRLNYTCVKLCHDLKCIWLLTYIYIWPIYILPFVLWLFDRRTTVGASHFMSPAFAATWSASDCWHPAPVTARFRQYVLQPKSSKSKTLGREVGVKTPTMHWHIVGQPRLREVTARKRSGNIACDSKGLMQVMQPRSVYL